MIASNLLSILLTAPSATQAVEALQAEGLALDEANRPALEGLHDAIQQVDADAADEFRYRYDAVKNVQGSPRERETLQYLFDILRDLSSDWGRIQRGLQAGGGQFADVEMAKARVRTALSGSASENGEILELLKRFAPNGLSVEEQKFLEDLFKMVQRFKAKESLLKIVQNVSQKAEVAAVNKSQQVAGLRRRTVADIFSQMLTCLLLLDYEKTLQSFEEKIAPGKLWDPRFCFAGPLEAKEKLLTGELDVVLGPAPSQSVAGYAAQLDTIFFTHLPDLSQLFDLYGERKQMPPACVVVHEAAHSSSILQRIRNILANETSCLLLESFYLLQKKGRKSCLEDMKISLQKTAELRDIWKKNISNVYGEAVAEMYANRVDDCFARFLEAAMALEDYFYDPTPGKDDGFKESFAKAKKAYVAYRVAQKFLNALDQGRSIAQTINEHGDRMLFGEAPRMRIENSEFKIDVVKEVSVAQTANLLTSQAIEVVLKLEKDERIAVEGYTALQMNQCFPLYAAFSLLAIQKGGADQAADLLSEFLIPLLEFVVQREFFGQHPKLNIKQGV